VLRLNAIGAYVFDQTNANANTSCPQQGSKFGNNDPNPATYPGMAAMVAYQNMQLPYPAKMVRNEWHPNDTGQPSCVNNAWSGHAFLE
jgi:hypothetical protein